MTSRLAAQHQTAHCYLMTKNAAPPARTARKAKRKTNAKLPGISPRPGSEERCASKETENSWKFVWGIDPFSRR